MTPSETIQLVSVCGTISLGALALIATIVKMVLDYKERRAHFRQATYGKQVEAFTELNLCVRKLFFHLKQANGKEMDIADRKRFADETACLCLSLQEAQNKWFLLFPLFVVNRLNDFLNSATSIINAFSNNQRGNIADLSNGIEKSYNQLVLAMRFSLGVDTLTDDVSKLLGSHGLIAQLDIDRALGKPKAA